MTQNELKEIILEELQKPAPDLEKVGELTERLVRQDDHVMRFSVDARHIHRLGFELVGKQETAISELVKNSYDADATIVNISISDYDHPGGSLVVTDDGVGMTENDIREKWMTLSTSDKEDNPVSSIYGRSRAGRKGIGRFATERLGSALILESRSIGDSHGVRVTFEWDKNYTHGRSLANISNQIVRFEKPEHDQGTTLTIKPLRDKWTERDFEKIWKSLLFLQSPFLGKRTYRRGNDSTEFEADPGFQVAINGNTNSESSANLSIENTFLQHRTAIIKGKVNSAGRAEYSVKSDVLRFEDKGTSDDIFLLTGELEFEAHYFIYASELMTGFAVRTAASMGKSHGGMRIYRDGFRVMPYGEDHDDWLQLSYDAARRSTLVPLNNANVFGHIEVTSADNELFEETASREGFIENEAFEELRSFVRQGLEWGANRVGAARGRKQSASEKGFVSTVRRPSELISDIIEDVINSPSEEPTSASTNEADVDIIKLAQAQKISKEYEEAVDNRIQGHIKYEELLRILASLGISISVFSHEVRGALTQVRAAVSSLKERINTEATEDTFSNIDAATERLDSIASYIIELISHTSSREKKVIPLSGVIGSFVEQFSNYMNTRGIRFEYQVDPIFLRTEPMHRSEIDSVLFNFLTNSVKAMERANTSDQRISIRAFREGDFAVLKFQDTGKGVPEELKDHIFDAFYTTSDQHRDEIAGPGTGLGLKIVSDIATSNRGYVRLSEPDDNFGCCLEFGVPVSARQTEAN